MTKTIDKVLNEKEIREQTIKFVLSVVGYEPLGNALRDEDKFSSRNERRSVAEAYIILGENLINEIGNTYSGIKRIEKYKISVQKNLDEMKDYLNSLNSKNYEK